MSSGKFLEELRQAAPLITVGVLTADLMSLGCELELIQRAGVKLLHIDVMDGRFCPMMTVGPPFIKAIKTPLYKDVHLMIEEPLDKLADFVAAGADIITINVESCRHIHRALQMLAQMKNVNDAERGILRGVVLNPATPLEVIKPIMQDLEIVFLLAVNPGFSGQAFIPSTREKFAALKQMLAHAKKDILTGIDGGVKKDNIREIAVMRPDIVVTGSAVFDGKAPLENAKFMMEALSKPGRARGQ